MQSQSEGDGDFLSAAEAAALLKVHPVTVKKMLRAGKLPGAKIGAYWRLSRQALTRYLSGELVPTPPAAKTAHEAATADPWKGAPKKQRRVRKGGKQ